MKSGAKFKNWSGVSTILATSVSAAEENILPESCLHWHQILVLMCTFWIHGICVM